MAKKNTRQQNELTNKVILISFEKNGNKTTTELVNFSKIDNFIEPQTQNFYIRVLCGDKFYYFDFYKTRIEQVEIF